MECETLDYGERGARESLLGSGLSVKMNLGSRARWQNKFFQLRATNLRKGPAKLDARSTVASSLFRFAVLHLSSVRCHGIEAELESSL